MAATPVPANIPPQTQQPNGPLPSLANGGAASQSRLPSGTPQPNGPAVYGASQVAAQPQANGAALRQTLAPRPAVPHPQLLASLARFAREMHKHPELDRRWIFSALNRVLGLKPGFEGTGKRDLAEGLERKLTKGMEGIVARYFEARVGKEAGGRDVLHPELVALFVEFRENFQRGNAGEKEKEMGEYMMLSCFDRVVGARDSSVFDGLKEEDVLDEGAGYSYTWSFRPFFVKMGWDHGR